MPLISANMRENIFTALPNIPQSAKDKSFGKFISAITDAVANHWTSGTLSFTGPLDGLHSHGVLGYDGVSLANAMMSNIDALADFDRGNEFCRLNTYFSALSKGIADIIVSLTTSLAPTVQGSPHVHLWNIPDSALMQSIANTELVSAGFDISSIYYVNIVAAIMDAVSTEISLVGTTTPIGGVAHGHIFA